MKTGPYTWPNEIVVEYADEFRHNVQWKGLDPSVYSLALVGARAELARLPAQTKARAVITATVVGRLDAKDPPLALKFLDQPDGWGNQGLYPARMILYIVKDIALTVDGAVVHPPPETPSKDR